MRIQLNSAAFAAQSKNLEAGQTDKKIGHAVVASSLKTMSNAIDQRCDKLEDAAQKAHDATTGLGLAGAIGFVVCAAAVTICTAGVGLAVAGGMATGLTAVWVAVTWCALPAALMGTVGCLIGKAIGGAVVKGDEDAAVDDTQSAQMLDAANKQTKSMMHEVGQANLQHGRDRANQAYDQLVDMLNTKDS